MKDDARRPKPAPPRRARRAPVRLTLLRPSEEGVRVLHPASSPAPRPAPSAEEESALGAGAQGATVLAFQRPAPALTMESLQTALRAEAPRGGPRTPAPLLTADDVHAALARDLLDHALRARSMTVRSDALLEALEHTARALGAMFDAETAKVLLARVAATL